MSDSNSNGKLIAAILVGAAIGGVLGVLFAPDKGSDTRKKIFSGAKDLADDVKEKVKEEVASLQKKMKEELS
jgi:gas vesicle protein